MKKIILAAMVVLSLGGCAAGGNGDILGGGMGTGNNVLKLAIDNQCRTELNSRNEWRVVALAMSQAQQQAWEDKICGCASEEALNHTGVNDVAQMMNPATRTQAIATVTAKTVTACSTRLFAK